MSEIERIEEIRFFLKFNKKTFAKVLGYANAQNYTNFLGGNSKLSMKMIKSLKKHDSRISIDWILEGQGQMLISQGSNNSQNITNDNGTISQITNNGNITSAEHSDSLEFLKATLKHLTEKNEQLKKSLDDKEEIIRLLKK